MSEPTPREGVLDYYWRVGMTHPVWRAGSA